MPLSSVRTQTKSGPVLLRQLATGSETDLRLAPIAIFAGRQAIWAALEDCTYGILCGSDTIPISLKFNHRRTTSHRAGDAHSKIHDDGNLLRICPSLRHAPAALDLRP